MRSMSDADVFHFSRRSQSQCFVIVVVLRSEIFDSVARKI